MKRSLQILKERVGRLADMVSDLTGYVAVRVPLQRAARTGEVTLTVPGYRQMDSYSCGGIAAAMVVKFLRPRMSFERIYAAVNPLRENGAANARIIRALRSLGVGVASRNNLAFDDICVAIDANRPVMVCVKTDKSDTDHWVLIYGYGRRPNIVFIAGQGLPFISRQRVAWRQFCRQWSPPGEGLICWKAKPRHQSRQPIRSIRTTGKK